jgi:hypothetical protein
MVDEAIAIVAERHRQRIWAAEVLPCSCDT